MEPINLQHHKVDFDEADLQSSTSINAFNDLVSYEQELVYKDVEDIPGHSPNISCKILSMLY